MSWDAWLSSSDAKPQGLTSRGFASDEENPGGRRQMGGTPRGFASDEENLGGRRQMGGNPTRQTTIIATPPLQPRALSPTRLRVAMQRKVR